MPPPGGEDLRAFTVFGTVGRSDTTTSTLAEDVVSLCCSPLRGSGDRCHWIMATRRRRLVVELELEPPHSEVSSNYIRCTCTRTLSWS